MRALIFAEFLKTLAVPIADIINKLAVPTIAGVSAYYVYSQYVRTARWKAGDLAATLVAQLDTDEELALACRALDWGVGPLVVPARYRPLVESTRPGIMDHDPRLLAVAMRPLLRPEVLEDQRGLVYRYAFDRMFTFLQNVNRLLEQGQLLLEDLHALRYWLARIAKYPYLKPGKLVFQPFLHAAEYEDVMKLGRKLGVEGWITAEDARECDDDSIVWTSQMRSQE
jgi:hypothetical protein